MNWLEKLAQTRGKVISEYKVDTLAQWASRFLEKHGRLPDKGELLAEAERLCDLNLWNRDLVTKLRSHVFGEEVERPPANPVEELLAKMQQAQTTSSTEPAKSEDMPTSKPDRSKK